MKRINIEDQLSEICLKCGMCCDGTLFNKASIKDEADKKIAQNLTLETFTEADGKHFFKLACHHFDQCCSIYDKIRPKICGIYFCKPLKDVKQGKLHIIKAQEMIDKALEYRLEVLKLAYQIDIYKKHNIRQLSDEILPHPTEEMKKNRELWLKLIGFIGVLSKITGNQKIIK
ncbi:YkgJ family cysteine cluster protein [Flavobacterium sp. FZUC8N2.13]|uniref:YkgJ family cysteine cluster protein n=1 Tax=Flavobacterium zubiriense TaxID=3138075 RepID=A0ABV4TAC4_9FLAO